MKKLPKFLYPLFWEIDPTKLDVDKRQKYVIERIMEWGDLAHLRWMMKSFPSSQLKESFCQTRNISKRTAPFWANFLGVDPEQTKCLSKAYQKQHPAIWPY